MVTTSWALANSGVCGPGANQSHMALCSPQEAQLLSSAATALELGWPSKGKGAGGGLPKATPSTSSFRKGSLGFCFCFRATFHHILGASHLPSLREWLSVLHQVKLVCVAFATALGSLCYWTYLSLPTYQCSCLQTLFKSRSLWVGPQTLHS